MTIKKVSLEAPFKKFKEVKDSIRGIKKQITRYRADLTRSRNPDYCIKREEKIEKLSLIVADLNGILKIYGRQ